MEIDTWKLIKILRLLRFLMRRVLPAPLAVFFQRKLALARLEVFLRPVIVALAVRALEADEVFLRHTLYDMFTPIEIRKPGAGIEPATYALPLRCSAD